MPFLTPRYDPWVVAASFLVACFASYVALDLAKRVRTLDRAVALSWWIGGSIAMGTGIWAMHFVGMLSFTLPIAVGYTIKLTFVSWLAAVAVSMVALWVASRGSLSPSRRARSPPRRSTARCPGGSRGGRSRGRPAARVRGRGG